jgi:hypothetical protein
MSRRQGKGDYNGGGTIGYRAIPNSKKRKPPRPGLIQVTAANAEATDDWGQAHDGTVVNPGHYSDGRERPAVGKNIRPNTGKSWRR